MLINIKDLPITVGDKTLINAVNFHVEAGEFIYIIGKVGAGKSSFLKTLYGERDVHKDGEARILEFDLHTLKRKQLPLLRRQLGIIFQDFQLLRALTVEKNLDFLLRATGTKRKTMRKKRIKEVLELVGLPEKKDKYPHELSGGEQQRISIARALLNNPKIILADEPTGNLDQEAGNRIVEILRDVSDKGTAVIMITHNLNMLQKYPGIVYQIGDGMMREVTESYYKPVEIENRIIDADVF